MNDAAVEPLERLEAPSFRHVQAMARVDADQMTGEWSVVDLRPGNAVLNDGLARVLGADRHDVGCIEQPRFRQARHCAAAVVRVDGGLAGRSRRSTTRNAWRRSRPVSNAAGTA
jgi:hypothetical protein